MGFPELFEESLPDGEGEEDDGDDSAASGADTEGDDDAAENKKAN